MKKQSLFDALKNIFARADCSEVLNDLFSELVLMKHFYKINNNFLFDVLIKIKIYTNKTQQNKKETV
jgi:hypothetical protein